MPDGRTEAPAGDRISVDVTVHLEPELAGLALELREVDPEFFSMVVRYGLLRRSAYRELSALETQILEDAHAFVFAQPRTLPQADGDSRG